MKRLLLPAAAFFSGSAAVLLMGVVLTPDFSSRFAPPASWALFGVFTAAAFLFPCIGAAAWVRRLRRAGKSISWRAVPAAVLVWNLLILGGFGAVEGAYAQLYRERGGWIARLLGVPGNSRAPVSPPAEPAAATISAQSESRLVPAPTDEREILRCALRGRLAAFGFGGYDFLDAMPECVTRVDCVVAGESVVTMLAIGGNAGEMKAALAALGNSTVADPEQAERARAVAQRVNRELEGALAPWGVGLNFVQLSKQPPRLVADGRRFLRAMSALKRRLEPEIPAARKHREAAQAKSGLKEGDIAPEVVDALADQWARGAEFSPESEGVRRITYRAGSPNDFPREIVLEDAAWRVRAYPGREPAR